MTGARGKVALQALFTVVGAIAVVTGVMVVAAGPDGIPGNNSATVTADNELRFFATFWIAFGLAAIRVAPRVETETGLVRALALTMFFGGIARAISWLSVGEPHSLFVSLMFVELLGAPLVIAWQAKLSA